MKPQGFFFVPPLAFLFFLAGPLPGFGQNDRQSIAEEIRALTESGIPSLMERALDQIQQRNLGTGEFGRIMSAVNVNLFRRVYPGINARFPSPDPPQSHNYARILRDAEQGVYTSPPGNSLDYLEFVLPFLALLDETREDRLLPALPDLRRAAVLNSGSVLAPLFIGMVHERTGNSGEAERAYRRALGLSAECYPAGLALARLKIQAGDLDGAIRDLQEMVRNFSDNSAVKQQLAVAYYRRGDWAQAETAIVEILRQDSRDGELLLMLAHALVEQGRFLSAQRPLELYAAVSGRNPFYHFLQARILEEGMGNREGAINSLRALVHSGAASGEALIYAVRLFLESPRSEDLEEGRALLKGLLEGNPGADVIRLAVRDNIKAGNWEAARDYLSPLLNDPRDGDLLSAYTIEQGLGNNAAALSYARDLYERNPDNDEGVAAYISALIETGRQAEAGRLIESRLAAGLTDSQKSPYYYLRSRIRSGDDQVVADLRASLFADPRNLSSLIAMFEFYHFRRPEKARALIYLRQALAQDPSNPQLRRYAAEYPEILMN